MAAPLDAAEKFEHLELVAHVAQDGFLKLSVISQAAGPRELDQHVSAGIEGLHVIAEDVLERCADEVVGFAGVPPRGVRLFASGSADVIGVEHLLHEELER